ncbi:MAG: EAL domain-containing protein [Pseudomonadota bacterium]
MPSDNVYAPFLDLNPSDFQLLDRYRDRLAEDADALAQDFYAYLLRHPTTAAVFRDFSSERLEQLTHTQAEHARNLLSSHLDSQWMDTMSQVGQLHYRMGVEPAWLAGAYILYLKHWERIIADEAMPQEDRSTLRGILFRLLIGDLMAQLSGFSGEATETDAERQVVFDVLLQTLSNPAAADDVTGDRLLNEICTLLVSKSNLVVWAGYVVREGSDEVLTPRCMAGIHLQEFRIHNSPEDPCWMAIRRKAPVIITVDAANAPEWVRRLPSTVKEVACIPFGNEDFPAVGVIGVQQSGYFQRVGQAYFLVFAHVGNLVLRIRSQALQDRLTGLPNRQLFLERLEQDRLQNLRRERLLGVGIFDLDGFKQVNDRLGHRAGDTLLRLAVERVQRLLRVGDTLARLGGDEFGLLLPDLERLDDLDIICERIMEELRKPFALDGDIVSISASFGFTICPMDDGDAENLLHHADLALYSAKEKGKDQCQLHTWVMDARIRSQAAQRESLAQALQDGRLLLHYQPIVSSSPDTISSSVVGVEALLRLDDGKGGIITPGTFADSLDHPRLARTIGRFVLNAALSQGENWHRQGLRMRVSMNISARHLLDPRFSADLEEALAQYPGIPADFLEIEVTESAPLRDFEMARQSLARVNGLGVRVALDDFGTGNASLTYLQKLPAQTIKVDQGFVRDIVNDPRDFAIVAGVITTARMLGLEVVAEGVETLRHAQILSKMNCHSLQGYLIAKPMPASAIPEWIAQYQLPEIIAVPISTEESLHVLVGHSHRVQQFLAALKGEEPFPEHAVEPGADRKCHLGIWLQTEGLARFGNEPAYLIITARHKRLHQLAREAHAAFEAGQNSETLLKAHILKIENDALLAEINALMQ